MQTPMTDDTAASTQIIRVAVLDDHQAVRAGIESAMRPQPGIACVGTASHPEQLGPLIYSTRPDVVVIDYHLPRSNGLRICRELKRDPFAPAVVIYSAYADTSLAVPAMVAGADALVDKAAPARELFEAIRCAAAGRTYLPSAQPERLAAARASVDPEDRPTFDLLVNGTPAAEIAGRLGVSRPELEVRRDRMLERVAIRVAVEPASATSRG